MTRMTRAVRLHNIGEPFPVDTTPVPELGSVVHASGRAAAGGRRWCRTILSLAVMLGAGWASAASVPRSDAVQSTVTSPRVYVLNSGEMLNVPNSFLQYGAQGTASWTPAAFFLIRHPKGDVLVDTGIDDREIAAPGSVWGKLAGYFGLKKSPESSIESQLASAGVKVDDIKYVILTHLHLDHAGNISKFPKATLIIQNEELKQAWWPDKGFEGAYLEDDIKDTKRFNVMRLDGNLDLFGDHRIELIRVSGHTPGSQIVVAHLGKTGAVLFTGDAVYTRQNLEKNVLPSPSGAWFAPGMLAGYQLIRHYRDDEGALLLYTHDGEDFKTYKHPPDYYD
jgi:N-acyl homoserine lactone hydrolase